MTQQQARDMLADFGCVDIQSRVVGPLCILSVRFKGVTIEPVRLTWEDCYDAAALCIKGLFEDPFQRDPQESNG